MEPHVSGARLILICGLPGAGKTTLAQSLEARLNAVRLSADDWMAALNVNLWDEQMRARTEALQWSLAQRLLLLGNIVIVEWGSWARIERDTLREGARAIGAAVELRYVSASIDVLLARVQSRRMEDSPITRDQLVLWSQIIQPPTTEELALYDTPL